MQKESVEYEEFCVYFTDELGISHSTEYIKNRIEEIVAQQYAHYIPLKPYVKEMLDMLVEWINTDPRGEKYRYLDWSEEYYMAENGDPNDTQTML